MALLVCILVVVACVLFFANGGYNGAPIQDAQSTPSSTPTGPINGTDLATCYIGTCQIAITRPVTIPLDPLFGIKRLTLSVSGERSVSVEATSTNGHTDDCETRVNSNSCDFLYASTPVVVYVVYIDSGTAVVGIHS
jgi:hypothetical protein